MEERPSLLEEDNPLQTREDAKGVAGERSDAVLHRINEDFCSFPEEKDHSEEVEEASLRRHLWNDGDTMTARRSPAGEEAVSEARNSAFVRNIGASPNVFLHGVTTDESDETIQREHCQAQPAIYRRAPPPKPRRAFVPPVEAATYTVAQYHPEGIETSSDFLTGDGFEDVAFDDDDVPEQDITDMAPAPRPWHQEEDPVVRLDLSSLAPAEADSILEVLGKDSVFRAEEKGRIDKIEAEVHEESQRQRSAEQQSKSVPRACVRCGRPFRIFFNKRLVCRLCAASVCRRCAAFEEGRGGWVCSVCQRERELQANKWLSEIQLRHRVTFRAAADRALSDSEDDSGYDPSVSQDGSTRHKPTDVAGLDVSSVTSEVRGNLENVVETLLGESIQGASIQPSPADAVLYRQHHIKLVTALSRLTQALCMTLQNLPVEEPLTPTTTLAELKTALQEAQQAAMKLPHAAEDDRPQVTGCEESREMSSLTSAASAEAFPEEPNSQTYEEILATAVLSQLAERARRSAAAPPNGTAFCDAAVQSDDVTTASDDVIQPENETDCSDQERDSPGAGMLEITIEEEYEEVVTYESAGEELEAEGPRRASLISQTSTLESSSCGDGGEDGAVVLPGPSISYSDLNFDGGQSVPFPEMGTSLPDSSSVADSADEPEASTWEENWLFRRRRLTQNNRLLGEDPVPMLVPDPSDPSVAVTVGSREVDELSELSERGSDSSLEEWRGVSPLPDVTERLRAASHADRDRYLAGRVDTADSRFLGEETTSELIAAAHRVVSASSEALVSGSNPASVAASAPPSAASEPQEPVSEAEMIYRKHCALKAAAAAKSLGGADSPRKSPQVERRIAQLEQKAQSATKTPQLVSEPAAARVTAAAAAPSEAVPPPLVAPRRGSLSNCSELVTQAGAAVQFRCRLPVVEAAEVHWLREGDVLEASPRVEMYRQRQHVHLTLYETARRDRGRYSCLVVAAGTETWHHFNLRVLSSGRTPQRPSLPLVPDTHQQLVSGGALRLLVRAAGFPEPRLTFLKGDRPLRRSATTSIERHSGGEWVLFVSPLAAEDSGQYQAQASSSQGTAQAQFQLTVLPSPEPAPHPDTPPLSPEPTRVRPATSAAVTPSSASPARPPLSTPPPRSPVTSPPEFVTSQEEALKETSLTEACNSVIMRARPARVRSPAEGGRDSDSGSDEEGICLPQLRSGTIAEREYRKWENAVEMPNNPYTRERVRQRRSRMLDRTGYYSQNMSSSGDDASDHDLARTDFNKINCGLKGIDSEMYRRDYYVNAGGEGRTASLPSRRKVTSRPVSVMSEEPLPPLSEHASTDDLPAAAGATTNGSIYHSAESLATAPTVVADGGSPSPALDEEEAEKRSGSPGSAELPPEGTVRSAIEKMQQLSRSAEQLSQGASPVSGRRSAGRLTASPAADVTNGAAASPPATPPPPPVPVENGADPSAPLYVEVGDSGELEQRPSPDGRESLGSSGSGDLPPQLPSVKQLRSHFQTDGPPAPAPGKPLSPLLHANVLIIEKSDPEAWDEPRELRKVDKLRKKMSNHKVHSLTARSVSREFREGLKLGAPLSLQSSGNIRDPQLVGQQRSSLPPVIDERGETAFADEEPEPQLTGAQLVAARAAFWDRKVAEELG